MRTKGEYHVEERTVYALGDDGYNKMLISVQPGGFSTYDSEETQRGNADFIYTAFKVAAALDEAGYDGEAAIREFPELVKALKAAVTDTSNPVYKYGDALTFANRIRKINDIMQVAFDKIRGDK
jgi:hypothetical protein